MDKQEKLSWDAMKHALEMSKRVLLQSSPRDDIWEETINDIDHALRVANIKEI